MENTKSRANGRQSSAESESKAQAGSKQAKASKNASDAKGCKTASDRLKSEKISAARRIFSLSDGTAKILTPPKLREPSVRCPQAFSQRKKRRFCKSVLIFNPYTRRIFKHF